jgi:hypothetical protein
LTGKNLEVGLGAYAAKIVTGGFSDAQDRSADGRTPHIVHKPKSRVAGGIVLGRMKKTSIYLDPVVDRALARRATAEGTTKAALIRAALAAATAPAKRVKPRACGVFDGPGDLAQNVDRYLSSTGFGER